MLTKRRVSVIMVVIGWVILSLVLSTGLGMELIGAPFREEATGEQDKASENKEIVEGNTPQEDINTPEKKEERWRREMKELLAFDKTTKINDEGQQIVINYNSIYTLVNKVRMLPSDYEPQDLVVPDVPFPFVEDHPKKYMRQEAAEALEKLFEAVKEQELDLFATSGYRSYARQKSIFDKRAAEHGEEVANRTSARPGQSEHQTGLAMDVTNAKVNFGLSEAFGETEEGLWLADNAHYFGFIIRYPKGKEHITGYSYEPWHLRYVGETLANYLYEKDLTLEEYFEIEHGY